MSMCKNVNNYFLKISIVYSIKRTENRFLICIIAKYAACN